MTPNEIQELKKKALGYLNNVDKPNVQHAIALYLQYGLYSNDKGDDFYANDENILADLCLKAASGWLMYLDNEIGKPVVYDFDLWADTMNFARQVLESIDVEIEHNFELVEAAQGIFVAAFRLWYEDITVKDIRNFLEDNPCPELPDMSDMRKTFLWAMENGIPCHDMTSLIKNSHDYLENQTAEQEIAGYMDMAKLRDTFDHFDDSLVTMGIPKDYLDKNRLQLREAYYAAVTFYEMIPHTMSIDELANEHPDQMERFFEKYCDICSLNDNIPNINEMNKEEQLYYSLVFIFGLQTGEMIVDIDGDEDALFRNAIEDEMRRDDE